MHLISLCVIIHLIQLTDIGVSHIGLQHLIHVIHLISHGVDMCRAYMNQHW